MARKVAIGYQDFYEIRKNNCFYIDKTYFIKEWWENMDQITLITRPRRFGKTLTMSMVEQFFSVHYGEYSDLFKGLEIWKEKKYRLLQGSYPVIFLSFANVKDTKYEDAYTGICQILTDLYSANIFLLDSGILSAEEKRYFLSVTDDMKERTAAIALHRLSGFLARYYGKKVIILLDEYDAPMQEAFVNGYWDELAPFIRKLFHSTFKTDPWLEKAILTGITRISRESVFSDLNNLEVVSTTSDKYETVFGFTEEEVFRSLEEYGLSEYRADMKKWYDGYTFGHCTNIYNPWSVTNFLDKRKFLPYWANTSSDQLISKLLWQGNTNIKCGFEKLLTGDPVKKEIDEQIVFGRLYEDESAIWSLLLASGYLKIKQSIQNRRQELEYVLTLTNYEVCRMFDRMFIGWFSKKEFLYHDFSNALLSDDVAYMNQYMNGIADIMFSYFDTGMNASDPKRPENFYHGFVLGLIADLKEIYYITSNRESGLGRYDVMLEPKETPHPAIIIEFKIYNPKKEHGLGDTVKNALRQIEEKKYAAALTAKGIPEKQIRKYGFAFQEKTVLIGSNTRNIPASKGSK